MIWTKQIPAVWPEWWVSTTLSQRILWMQHHHWECISSGETTKSVLIWHFQYLCMWETRPRSDRYDNTVHNASASGWVDVALSRWLIMCLGGSSKPFERAQIGVAMSSSKGTKLIMTENANIVTDSRKGLCRNSHSKYPRRWRTWSVCRTSRMRLRDSQSRISRKWWHRVPQQK